MLVASLPGNSVGKERHSPLGISVKARTPTSQHPLHSFPPAGACPLTYHEIWRSEEQQRHQAVAIHGPVWNEL